MRGLAYLRAGMLDAAHADLKKATEVDPKHLEARYGLGVVILEQGDAATAQETFEFNGADPLSEVGDAMSWAQLGKAAEADGRLAKLIAEKGVAGDAAATNLASLRRATGNGEGAWKVIPDKPLTAVGWMLRGMLLVERKDGKRAIPALQAATNLAPNYLDAWLLLAKALETGGDAAGAKNAANRALEIAPNQVEALATLARIYGKEGDTTRQAAALARIREVGEKATAAASSSKHTIAVVTFDNNSGDKTLDWMRNGVPEALISDLAHLGSLTIIERTQVQKAFQEQKLQELGFTDAKDASKVGKLLGADAILVGGFTKSGDQIRLDGRVLEVGSTKVIKTGSAQGALSQIFDVERKLALDLVSDYAAVTSKEKVDFFAAKTPSVASLETQSRIRMLSSQGKAQEAKAAYEKLLREDPKAAEKFKDMQKQWESTAATVAILPLKNVAERPEDQWLGVGIAEALTTERQQVEKLMQERQLTEMFNEAEAVKLGKLAGASILFVGSYQVQGSYLRIDGRLVDVSTSQVLQTYTVEGKKDELFEAENKLVKQVAAALKVEPSKIEKEQLASGKPSIEDFKRYIQASSKLVVKQGATQTVEVHSLAVGELKDATGTVEKSAASDLKSALERNGPAPVRTAATANAKEANADALVLGTLTRLPGKVRLDLRAVHAATGEVVASATAIASAVDQASAIDQAAANLLSTLGLRKSLKESAQSSKSTPVYKKWWLWTLIGVAVAGGAVAGAVVGTLPSQSIPRSDATITAR